MKKLASPVTLRAKHLPFSVFTNNNPHMSDAYITPCSHAQTPAFTPSPSSHAACPRCLRCLSGNCTRYVKASIYCVGTAPACRTPSFYVVPKPSGHAEAFKALLRSVPLLLVEMSGVGLRSLLGKRPRWQLFLPAGL